MPQGAEPLPRKYRGPDARSSLTVEELSCDDFLSSHNPLALELRFWLQACAHIGTGIGKSLHALWQ